jgi:hypothetical protein
MTSHDLPVEFLFTLELTGAAEPEHTFTTSWGGRRATRAQGGSFAGPRLQGEVVKGLANDWGACGADGALGVDAHVVLRTSDGAPILMSFLGRVDDERHVRISPVFETSTGPYDWLTEIQAVGVGGPRGDDLVIDVYALK